MAVSDIDLQHIVARLESLTAAVQRLEQEMHRRLPPPHPSDRVAEGPTEAAGDLPQRQFLLEQLQGLREAHDELQRQVERERAVADRLRGGVEEAKELKSRVDQKGEEVARLKREVERLKRDARSGRRHDAKSRRVEQQPLMDTAPATGPADTHERRRRELAEAELERVLAQSRLMQRELERLRSGEQPRRGRR